MPRVTVDNLFAWLAQLPAEIQVDYGRRNFSLFTHVIYRFLGRDWVERRVLRQGSQIGAGIKPANNSTEFMELNFTSGDERRELSSLRVFDLAELLINLQMVEGFDECVERMRTGNDEQIEATYAELQFAKLLYVHDYNFRIVVSSGVRTADYDFEMSLPSHPVVCIDAKCKIESRDIDPASVRGTLNKGRQQLPRDKPGIIFVKVPQHWFDQAGMTEELRRVASEFLRGTGSIVSVKYYISHVSFANQQTLHQHAFDEINNPRNRFPPQRNWDLFRGFRVPPEWKGAPPKWIRLLNLGVENG